ncbi:hypothetical protein GCM10022422_14750 [Flavobacterium ginsengisoli]|uniref:DUF4595 domain-containing protein n=2 Tax=Flavobacterium ginsengisoli TaxID=871694 RepID=A0ABP7F7P8_9FLAO
MYFRRVYKKNIKLNLKHAITRHDKRDLLTKYMKKIILLFVLALGLTSCSNDSQDDNSQPEVVYADVKPTQSKYKAYYGAKITKSTGQASKTAEVGSGTETIKPVSVIFYPRTQTIGFSNIFDNSTVEYKVTNIVKEALKTIYSFQINNVAYTCTISAKTDSTAANVVISFSGGSYKFDISESSQNKIAKLVSKVIYTSKNVSDLDYVVEYTYADTLLIKSIRNYKDQVTLKPSVLTTDYKYDGSRLIEKTVTNDNGNYTKISYEYENNFITKATSVSSTNQVRIYIYEYDNQGRLSKAFGKTGTGTSFFDIITYTYEKNKLTSVVTDSAQSFRDTEVSIYESDRKPFLISQELILNPFLYMNFTHSGYTDMNGEYSVYWDRTFEYTPDGYLTKMLSEDDSMTYEYIEE